MNICSGISEICCRLAQVYILALRMQALKSEMQVAAQKMTNSIDPELNGENLLQGRRRRILRRFVSTVAFTRWAETSTASYSQTRDLLNARCEF